MATRARRLQLLGILCGFTAGAWLGAAEAPTKPVTIGISPIVISLIMVGGVFLARWSLPALVLGTSSVRADVRRAPHLVHWALLAGCLWAVANTLTIFAIRDIGLSIAFPLWNSNSLIGIFWGFLFFERAAAGWLVPLDGRPWRRLGDVRRRGNPCYRFFFRECSRSFLPWRVGPSRGGRALGNDVHSLPEGLSDRNESAFVRDIFHVGELGMMSALALA
jgi:Transmembrane family, TMEM144 of transporters